MLHIFHTVIMEKRLRILMSKSSSMNSFQATDLFLYTLKTSENGRLSMFSRGIERGQWHELDYVTHGRFI